MLRQVIEIGRMTCGHCMGRVRQALSALPGVTVDRMTVGQATVTFDDGAIDATTIAQAIADAGFDVLQAN